ncbi:hypothetical protein FRB99_005245 [Tulasnella sp. 403]|nr:hypothetical protein FRB99_005245 [Tulasnella sp. 403]
MRLQLLALFAAALVVASAPTTGGEEDSLSTTNNDARLATGYNLNSIYNSPDHVGGCVDRVTFGDDYRIEQERSYVLFDTIYGLRENIQQPSRGILAQKILAFLDFGRQKLGADVVSSRATEWYPAARAITAN